MDEYQEISDLAPSLGESIEEAGRLLRRFGATEPAPTLSANVPTVDDIVHLQGLLRHLQANGIQTEIGVEVETVRYSVDGITMTTDDTGGRTLRVSAGPANLSPNLITKALTAFFEALAGDSTCRACKSRPGIPVYLLPCPRCGRTPTDREAIEHQEREDRDREP